MNNFIVDPSSADFDQISLDLRTFLESRPDAARWQGFFDSQVGTTIIQMMAGMATYLQYNTIVSRREAYAPYAQNRSSIIGFGQSVGYSADRGRNAVVTVTIVPNFTGVLDAFSIIGSVKDVDLVLLEATTVNDGVAVTVDAVVGSLLTETQVVPSANPQAFRFQNPNVSQDIRVKINGELVETSERMVDLIDEKFIVQSNVLSSVDVYYINLASFTLEIETGDNIEIEYIQLRSVDFELSDIVFDFGAVQSSILKSVFVDVENQGSLFVNAQNFNETQGLIRGRLDYEKLFLALRNNIVDTSHRDISPAVVELLYVLNDSSLFNDLEKVDLITELSASRPMGIEPPTIADPTIVFLPLSIDVTLLSSDGDPVNSVEGIVSTNEFQLGHKIKFTTVEQELETLEFIKIARVRIKGQSRQSQANYVRGAYITAFPDNGLVYEATDILYFSGDVEPAWPLNLGDTIVDGGICWELCGTVDACTDPGAWSPGTEYPIGSQVQPTTPNGFFYCAKAFVNQSGSSLEIQLISFPSVPQSGTYRLEFNGEETGDIPFDASAGDIANALNGLNGLSDVIVTGDTSNGFEVQFAGDDSNQAQPQITINGAGLNEKNCIAWDILPNTGTFRIEYQGQTTMPLAFNITNAALQGELETLASIGNSNVVVNDGEGADTYEIEFQGTLGLQNLAGSIVITDNQLFSSTGLAATVADTVPGVLPDPGLDEVQLIRFSQVPDSGVSEVQEIAFNTPPDVGQFQINFNGQTTPLLDFNTNAATVQAELENLSSIGAGSVVVTGDFINGFVLTFQGDLELSAISQVVVLNSSLEAGGIAVITTINTLTQGVDAGEWALNFNGSQTTDFGPTTTAAQVQAALEALPTINSGNVTVTGDFANDFVITFVGSLAKADQNLIASTPGTLTREGVDVTITVVVDTEGVIPDIGTDAQQSITFDFVPPDAGDFQIRYNGVDTTSTLDFNTTAALIQTALNNLTSLTAVTVSGDFVNGFIVAFQGVDGKQPQPILEVVNSTLGNSSAAVTPTVTICQEGQTPAANLTDGGGNAVNPVVATPVDAVSPEPNWAVTVGLTDLCS